MHMRRYKHSFNIEASFLILLVVLLSSFPLFCQGEHRLRIPVWKTILTQIPTVKPYRDVSNGSPSEPKATGTTVTELSTGSEVTSYTNSSIEADLGDIKFKSNRTGEVRVKEGLVGTLEEDKKTYSKDTSTLARTGQKTQTRAHTTTSRKSTKITPTASGLNKTESEVERKIQEALSQAILETSHGGNVTIQAKQTAEVVTEAYADLIVAAGSTAKSEDGEDACAKVFAEIAPHAVSTSISKTLASSSDPRIAATANDTAEKLQAASVTVSGSARADSCASMGKADAEGLLISSAYDKTVSSIIEGILVVAKEDGPTTTRTAEVTTGAEGTTAEVETITTSGAEGAASGDADAAGEAAVETDFGGEMPSSGLDSSGQIIPGGLGSDLQKKWDKTPVTTVKKTYYSPEPEEETTSPSPSSPEPETAEGRWQKSSETTSSGKSLPKYKEITKNSSSVSSPSDRRYIPSVEIPFSPKTKSKTPSSLSPPCISPSPETSKLTTKEKFKQSVAKMKPDWYAHQKVEPEPATYEAPAETIVSTKNATTISSPATTTKTSPAKPSVPQIETSVPPSSAESTRKPSPSMPVSSVFEAPAGQQASSVAESPSETPIPPATQAPATETTSSTMKGIEKEPTPSAKLSPATPTPSPKQIPAKSSPTAPVKSPAGKPSLATTETSSAKPSPPTIKASSPNPSPPDTKPSVRPPYQPKSKTSPKSSPKPAPKTRVRAPPKPATKTQVRAPSKPVTKTQVRQPPKPAAKTQVRIPSKPATRTQVRAPPKPAAKTQVRTPPKPAAKTQVREPSRPATKTQVRAPPKPSTKTQVRTPPKPAAKTQVRTPPKPAAKTPARPPPSRGRQPVSRPPAASKAETEQKRIPICTGIVRARCCGRGPARCPCGRHPDGSFCVARRTPAPRKIEYVVYSGWKVLMTCQCPMRFVF